MSTIEEVQASLAAVQGSVDALTEAVTAEAVQVGGLITEIAALKEQIANGSATPEQLDALLASAQSIQQNLESATANVAGLVPDAPPPVE